MHTSYRLILTIASSLLLFNTVTSYSSPKSLTIHEIVESKLLIAKKLARSPVIIRAVQRQNNTQLSLAVIKERDKQWVNSSPNSTFKIAMQNTAVGNVIKLYLKAKTDIFNEIFLTDNQGANVTAYPATTDYWQGDENKFIKSFNSGSGIPYVGDIQFDKSTQTYAAHISVPVINKGKTIGVLIFGIRLSHAKQVRTKLNSNSLSNLPPGHLVNTSQSTH